MNKPISPIKEVLGKIIKPIRLTGKMVKSFCIINSYTRNRRQSSLEALF